jgi:hypothetical protein
VCGATLSYSRRSEDTPTPAPGPHLAGVLTSRTSARLQAKIVENLKDVKLPRGGFVKKLAQEFNVTRDFTARMLSKLRSRPTGASDACVGSGTSCQQG